MSSGRITLALVWIALAAALFYLADRALNPNKLHLLGEDRSVVLQRGLDGHYSQQVADRLGLQSRTAVRTRTANGDAVGYMTRLDSVRIGGVEARDVSAMIAPGLGGDVLLGMSFLARMDVRLYQGTMTIRQVEP